MTMNRRTVLQAASAAALCCIAPGAFAASKDTLIVMYTRTGANAALAKMIADATGAPVLKLETRVPYAASYSAMTDGARAEVQSWARRELSTRVPDLAPYKKVFVVSPLWWGQLNPPTRTFLTDHPLAGKDVYPVTTSASSSPEGVFADIRKLCPKAKVHEGLWLHESDARGAKAEVLGWLKKNGF